MSGENTSNYKEQGGARDVIGGSLDVVSGGEIDIESGGAFKVAGTDVINRLAKLAPSNAAEVVTTANVITAAENGKTFYLDAAGGFASTLPAPFLGGEFEFIVKTPPSSGAYTVVTDSSSNVIRGHVLSGQDAGGSGDYETDGGDTITFVQSKADVGDKCFVKSDGTYWYVSASSFQFDSITVTTAS